MKQTITKVLALVLVLVSIFTTIVLFGAVGCSGSGGNQAGSTTVDPAAAIIGKYYLTSMDSDGEAISMDKLVEEGGLDPEEHYIEFKDGGILYVTLFDDSSEGTYTIDGNTLALTIDEETNNATIDGKKITLDFGDGGILYFEAK